MRQTSSRIVSLFRVTAVIGVSLCLMSWLNEAVAVQQTEIVNPATPLQQDKKSSDPSGSVPSPSNPANTDSPEGGAGAASGAGNMSTSETILGLSWIDQQPRTNYTLQLMAAESPAPLQKYARKVPVAPLAIACFQKEDKVLHLLLQGSYATRSEADNAAAQFEVGKGGRPWVRKFASLPKLFDSNTPPAPRRKVLVKSPPPPVMGAAWLWSRNPVHYTVQLMGDRRVARLRSFVDKARPAGPLAIVRIKRKGTPWFLLFTGDYASEDEALAAIKALPKKVSGAGPWPRSFAALQDHMVASNH